MAALIERAVENQLGKLEADVDHLRGDVAEIKLDVRELRNSVGGLKDSLAGLRDEMHSADATLRHEMSSLRIWMLLTNGAVLGLMAHGFKWL